MFIIMRKCSPSHPVEICKYVFEEKQDAVDQIDALGFAEWNEDQTSAVFADGSFYSIQEHDPVMRH